MREQQKQLELSKAKRYQTIGNVQAKKEKLQMKVRQDVVKFKESLQVTIFFLLFLSWEQAQKADKENRDIQNYVKNVQTARVIKDQERKQKILKEAQRKEQEILNRISYNTKAKEKASRFESQRVRDYSSNIAINNT